ncbi:hypothetical protein MUK42_15942 [Musa troglodytarum]|uniref:Uncharacterized protein n=1 Tax=Musa troglodytarum TaxID=320322 RepID=A0A9E7HM41_9LILI|nr:hypothetical protein MUK42_15942 [Musa troglodytarum]
MATLTPPNSIAPPPPDPRPPTTEDSPSTNGGPGGCSAPLNPSSSKPLPGPDEPASPAAAMSRRSDRKRKPREFGGRSSSGLRQMKVWSEPDEVALLEGALAFRSRTGALPKQPTVSAFFASIKTSIATHLTPEQVGYKLKRLKSKFVHSAAAGSSAVVTAHDRRICELSAEIWGEEAKQADGDAEEDGNGDMAPAATEEEDDVGREGDKYPFIREAVAEYGRCLSGVLLEKKLKLIDDSKGKLLEEKLRKQCEAEMELWAKRLDLGINNDMNAEIQASLVLQKPISLLATNAARLENDILEEIGIPNTKVSVIYMHSLDPENSTYVVFGFLPDPKNASISLSALSILRSTLINLVLQQINISLTSSIFGHPSSFELLKFPGGITVIPLQSDSIWDIAHILFNFTLNNNIEEILENIGRLKDELKFGLNLRSYENVYVKLTNINGSTVTPPVTVEASVLSDMGSGSLLPDRMKQLAQVITRPNANNLGLNNSVFGKVKQVQLSSYLEHSLSMAPGPSPSGSPPVGNLYPEPPASLNPTLSPAPVPSDNHHRQPPCFCCHTFPIKNPMAYAPAPENGIQPDSQSASAPGPSRRNGDPFTNCFPCPSLAPNIGSSVHPYLPTLSGHLRHLASPPSLKAMGPTPKVHAKHSPSSPAASYASRPVQVSESAKAATYAFWEINLTRLLGLLIFQLVCGPR